jgi:hypothetical protein
LASLGLDRLGMYSSLTSALRIGVLLDGRLDGCHLLWLDQCRAIFGQGGHAVDALVDGVAWWNLRNWFALTLARTNKVVAGLAGTCLPRYRMYVIPLRLVQLSGILILLICHRHDMSCTMQSRFFLIGIVSDIARVDHAIV